MAGGNDNMSQRPLCLQSIRFAKHVFAIARPLDQSLREVFDNIAAQPFLLRVSGSIRDFIRQPSRHRGQPADYLIGVKARFLRKFLPLT
jgi:hypothetical protein